MSEGYTQRGFERCTYGGVLVQQSSEIGDYDDAFERPGSSALWIREPSASVNREGVAELRDALTRWLETGSLIKEKGGPNE